MSEGTPRKSAARTRQLAFTISFALPNARPLPAAGRNHEKNCRALIEFCDLPWDDRCLEFHKAKRSVRTASNWQVRQPLYGSSVGRWRKYEKHLGALQQELALSATP